MISRIVFRVIAILVGLLLLTTACTGKEEELARVADSPEPALTATPGIPALAFTNFSQLSFPEPETGWLIGTFCRDQAGVAGGRNVRSCEGLIEATTTAGKTWTEQYRGEIEPLVIQSAGKLSAWIIGRDGDDDVLLATTDGGADWREVYRTSLRLRDIALSGPDNLWLLAQECDAQTSLRNACSGHLLSTMNSGSDWQDLPLPAQGSGFSLSRVAAEIGYIQVGQIGPLGYLPPIFLQTRDSGLSWHPVSVPSGQVSFEQTAFFLTPTLGWMLLGGQPGAGSQTKQLFVTSDGAATWEELSASGPREPVGTLPKSGYVGSLLFTSELNGMMLSPRAGVLHTSDGGRDWSVVLPNGAGGSLAVSFSDPRNGWALSSQTLWRTDDGGATWIPATGP